MRQLALYLRKVLDDPETGEPVDLCSGGHRYAMFKVGPVLTVSHGVGSSTFSVVLHELLKLVKYAGCKDPVFLRIGTCGGVGVPPGTVVVTKNAFNGFLRNEHEIVSGLDSFEEQFFKWCSFRLYLVSVLCDLLSFLTV